jgi:flagellar basal body rod protein FlgB
MVSADEHFERTLDEFRMHAHTKHTVDVDPEMMQFPDADIAYVRLFAFFLSSLLFFFFSLRARSANDETKIIRARKE